MNVTPDSFSDGGQYFDPSAALGHASELVRCGANYIDIGGESTGPGSNALTADEEWQRIGKIVDEIAGLNAISLDTYHAETAKRGLERGVRAINDVSAGRADPGMIPLVADSDATYVMTYAKDHPLPHASVKQVTYDDVVGHLSTFFRERIDQCLRAGFAIDRLIVDPGLGQFVSANPDDSWQILANIERLIDAVDPVPIMIGASRKGFLGGKLGERDPVSQFVSMRMVERGARHIRTHNVAMLVQMLKAETWLAGFSGQRGESA